MKKLIGGKVRDTKEMVRIAGRSGDPNQCYSTFAYVLFDARDKTCYLFAGNHWAGLGPDSLEALADPLAHIEEAGYELSDQDVEAMSDYLDA